MLNAPNIQWPRGEDAVMGDRGTMALGIKDVDPGVPEVIVATEDFEVDPISGSGTWTISLITPHSGLRCLRSAVIGVSQSTDYTFNIPPTATHIRFWWRVSSENNADFFRVYKDAIIPGNLLLQASGTTNDVYAQATLDVTGAATVTFRYIKDGSLSGGLDRAIIDDIEWIIPGVPAVLLYEPFHLNEDDCVKVVLCDNEVTVTGTVETRPLSCETDSVTVCFDDPLSITGIVQVEGEVSVTGEINTRPLTCDTDSVTICVDDPLDVIVTNFPASVEISNDVGNPVPVSFARLTCGTDSVEVCNDVGSPLTVNVNNTITVVPGRRSLRGVYFATSGPLAYTTAADAATGGDLWLVNTSNTVVVYLREVRYTSNIAALALLTALPIIRMERMTFVGAPSGPIVTPARRDSLDFANTGTVRTTNAGMAPITTGAGIKSFAPPSSDIIGGLLAANASSAVPAEQLFVADLDSFIVLRQNEGIVFRQSTAGSVTENRQYQVDIIWEEI